MSSIICNVSITTSGCLVKREFNGGVSVNQMIDSLESIVDAYFMKFQSVKVMFNLSKCTLEFTREEYVNLMTYLKAKRGLRKIIFAVITEIPKNAVFAHVAEHTIPCLKIKLFSTTDAAENWLLMN